MNQSDNKNEIRKYLNYLSAKYQIAVQRMLIFRVNFIVVGIFEILDLMGTIIFLNVIYYNISSLAGWSKYELFILYGTFRLQLQVLLALCISGINNFSNHIRNGSFDYVLLKPINSRFISLFSDFNLQQVITMIPAIYLIIYGLWKLNLTIAIWDMGYYLVLFGIGVFILINIFSIIISLAFWFVKVDSLVDILFTIIGFSKEPSEIYHGFLLKLFTFLIPIVLIANPAVKMLLHGCDLKLLLTSLVMAILSYLTASIIWNKSIEKYQSASS